MVLLCLFSAFLLKDTRWVLKSMLLKLDLEESNLLTSKL